MQENPHESIRKIEITKEEYLMRLLKLVASAVTQDSFPYHNPSTEQSPEALLNLNKLLKIEAEKFNSVEDFRIYCKAEHLKFPTDEQIELIKLILDRDYTIKKDT